MEPLRAPIVAEIRLGLGYLVSVMRESVVDSSAVQVEVFAVVFFFFSGALDVPARLSEPPRRLPFELLILKL